MERLFLTLPHICSDAACVQRRGLLSCDGGTAGGFAEGCMGAAWGVHGECMRRFLKPKLQLWSAAHFHWSQHMAVNRDMHQNFGTEA